MVFLSNERRTIMFYLTSGNRFYYYHATTMAQIIQLRFIFTHSKSHFPFLIINSKSEPKIHMLYNLILTHFEPRKYFLRKYKEVKHRPINPRQIYGMQLDLIL